MPVFTGTERFVLARELGEGGVLIVPSEEAGVPDTKRSWGTFESFFQLLWGQQQPSHRTLLLAYIMFVVATALRPTTSLAGEFRWASLLRSSKAADALALLAATVGMSTSRSAY